MKAWRIGIIIGCGLAGLGAGISNAYASGTVTISPPAQTVIIGEHQTQASFNYTVTNNDEAATHNFTLSTADFGSLNESGGVAFVGTDPAQVRQYGLIHWLHLSTTTLTLAPHQTQTVQATVTNDADLAPGGHYGAILVTEQATGPATSSDQVVVRPVLSTLVFVQKQGGERYGLQLAGVTRANQWWQSLELNLRFYNSGNVDVVPRGVVRLIGPGGREVARAAINQESARILPETYRQLSLILGSDHSAIWPGRYKLEIQYRYDGKSSFTTVTRTLYYINWWAIAAIIGLAVLLVAGLALGWRFYHQARTRD